MNYDSANTFKVSLVGFGSWSRQACLRVINSRNDIQIIPVAASSSKTLKLAENLIGESVKTNKLKRICPSM